MRAAAGAAGVLLDPVPRHSHTGARLKSISLSETVPVFCAHAVWAIGHVGEGSYPLMLPFEMCRRRQRRLPAVGAHRDGLRDVEEARTRGLHGSESDSESRKFAPPSLIFAKNLVIFDFAEIFGPF